MLSQIGVLSVDSSNALFAQVMRNYAVVQEVGADYAASRLPDGGPRAGRPSRSSRQQWSMQQIQAPDRRTPSRPARRRWTSASSTRASTAITSTSRTGSAARTSTARAATTRSRSFRTGPAPERRLRASTTSSTGRTWPASSPRRANGIGVVGVAPNVTLVPVKVCDASGYCYASAVVDGITYAGRREARRHQHELLRRRRRVPGVDRAQVRLGSKAARLQAGRGACNPLRAEAGRRPGGGARQLRPGSRRASDSECMRVVPAESPGVIATIGARARRRRRRATRTGATGRPTWPLPAVEDLTGVCSDDGVLSTIPGGATRASRERRWPLRTRPAWRR